MKHRTLVGFVSQAHHLSRYPLAPEGLHYSREVLFFDSPTTEKFPRVGRGKAVAAGGDGAKRYGRILVVWGKEAEIKEHLRECTAACVVALHVGGPSPTRVLADLAAKGVEVHLCTTLATGPLRIVATDATRIGIEQCNEHGWVEISTRVSRNQKAAKPAQPKGKKKEDKRPPQKAASAQKKASVATKAPVKPVPPTAPEAPQPNADGEKSEQG